MRCAGLIEGTLPSSFQVRPAADVSGRRGNSGCLLARLCLDEHPHDVAFLHDQVLDVVDLDLGPRPFAEQHPVTGLDIDRDELAGLVAAARTDCDDLALLRLFLRGVRDDDAAGRFCLGVNALDHNAVVKGAEFH